MIDRVLKTLVDGLNRHLATRFSSSGPLALLSPVVGADNAPPQGTKDRVLVTLVNLERESVAENAEQRYRPIGDDFLRAPPPLNLNLVVLVSANFPDNYSDGFAVLSSVLSYLQARPVFDAANTPDLPQGLQRLTIEWKEMSLSEVNNLWTVLGGRYLPSAVFLMRMLVLEDPLASEDTASIRKIGTESAQ